jgi:tRNA-Thr(GGU) m(6)t(6)A37 methyltransferase TsaA
MTENTDPPRSAGIEGDGAHEGSIACAAIGVVHTPFDRRDEAPRQGFRADARGELELDEAFERGLRGVAPGDELDVVWYADRADRSVLEVGGHGTGDRDRRGVFASRSQDRPTPVCLTRCRVLSVEGTRVLLEGVDMLDGTPVLDLKSPLSYDG